MPVHAELQVILFMSEIEHPKHDGYIGGSKYSCELCGRFLKAHGEFKTAGSHRRLYNLIPIPGEKLDLKGIRTALKRVQNDMANEIRAISRERSLRHENSSLANSNGSLRKTQCFSSQSTIGSYLPNEDQETIALTKSYDERQVPLFIISEAY